jgi:hypothetical protein
MVHKQYLDKTCHHYLVALDRAYLETYSDAQIIYLPGAFFGFSIAASEAEL